LVRSELREHLVQVPPRFIDHLHERRAALRDGVHPVLEVARHLGICDVRTVDRQGVDQGASRGRGPDRTAPDVLPAEQEVEDLVTRRFRAEAEPLHREEECPLRVKRRRRRPIFDDPHFTDGEFLALLDVRERGHLMLVR
jgi:hypothetical protein